jgi:hypothetical protein
LLPRGSYTYSKRKELMKYRPFSSAVLALCGLILMGLGLYFVFLRPPLLPEDLRFIGTSLATLQITAPTLLIWLRRVFWVLGAYLFTSGLLTLYLALTSFRTRARGVSGVITLAGLTSVGWMAVVNFLIDSDFKWFLLALAVLWGCALMLYRLGR